MSRVTSKLQVTIPKAVATRYGIEPGTDVDWLPAGDAIRVVPRTDRERRLDPSRRLELFDRATERQRRRGERTRGEAAPGNRGWRRDDLYERGGAR